MARKASSPVVLHGLEWLAVGIVAGAAPKTSATVAGASAESKLLDMAYDFQTADSRAWWQSVVIDGEGIFHALPGNKVADFLAGVGDTRDTKQVTLFADAIASRRLESCRINDRARTRIREVLFDRAMAAFASDGFRRENG
jgi:hypothetical protein